MDPKGSDSTPKPAPFCAVCLRKLGADVDYFVHKNRTTCISCYEAERRVLRRLGKIPKELE